MPADEAGMERYARAPVLGLVAGAASRCARYADGRGCRSAWTRHARLMEYNRSEGPAVPAGAADVTAAAVATPRALRAGQRPGRAVATAFPAGGPMLRKALHRLGRAAPVPAPRCGNVGTSLIPDVPMLIRRGPHV